MKIMVGKIIAEGDIRNIKVTTKISCGATNIKAHVCSLSLSDKRAVHLERKRERGGGGRGRERERKRERGREISKRNRD